MPKCWLCRKEMTHTVGGCYHCEHCGQTAVNDLVLRYKKDEDVPGLGYRSLKVYPEQALAEAEENAYKKAAKIAKKYVDKIRTEILSCEIWPELTAVQARDTDLDIFNDYAGDMLDELVALFDGPPCEDWTDGSYCRTCEGNDCPNKRKDAE